MRSEFPFDGIRSFTIDLPIEIIFHYDDLLGLHHSLSDVETAVPRKGKGKTACFYADIPQM